MASDPLWKKWEREVAVDLGGKRMYSSGSFDHEGKQPDVDGIDDFYVECKSRKSIPFLAELEEALANAEKDGKYAVIALKERAVPGYRSSKAMLMDYDQFIALIKEYRKFRGIVQRIAAETREDEANGGVS